MASSGYTAITFVANEQPTTAKWNLIGSNDASFNTGNGFNDGILVTRHFSNNAVPAAALATDAIILGSTASTTSVSTNAGLETTIMSVTATVPAGGRSVLLMFTASQIGPESGVRLQIKFKEGSTVLQNYYHVTQNSGETFFCIVPAPSAGAHTYVLTATRDIGTVNAGFYADNIAPSKLQMIALLV